MNSTKEGILVSEEQQGLTRRQILKRGAVFGGALVWAVPVVQTIGMTPALADTTSPGPGGGCGPTYAIKIYPDGQCEDIYLQTADKGEGHCLDVVGFGGVEFGGCGKYSLTAFASDALANDGPVPWVISFLCPVKIKAYSVKSGDKAFEGGIKRGETGYSPLDGGYQVTFSPPEQDISHVEIIFCCDGEG